MVSFEETRVRLHGWRKEHKITLGAFAALCGLKSASAVCEWESGNRVPSFESALAIERATDRWVRVEDWGYDRKTARRDDVAALASTGTDSAR